MRRTLMMFVSLFALATVAVFFQPKSAHAYPGFARKYNFPCAFCHIQWPKLGDTGHFFKDRGFMMSNTGKGNGLDMMFEKPGNQNYFPIGFHMSMAYNGSSVNGIADPNTGKSVPSWANGDTANTPWDIESGGLLNNWISFWVQPGYNGGGLTSAGQIGIVKLWVRFNDLLNTTWLNLYVGKTSIDAPFSNQRNVYIGTPGPWTMYDYSPGQAEISNFGATSAPMAFGYGGLYYDGDTFSYANDIAQFRYFGYHINSPASCMTQSAFSLDPCETRVSVSFMPNSSIYGSNNFGGANVNNGGFNNTCTATSTSNPVCSNPLGNNANNGFNFFAHITQSFGGWGRTNGERVGVFALVGEGTALPGGGVGAGAPSTTFSREGVDFMMNPIPNGGLNVFAAWDIVNDPTGLIAAELPGMGAVTSGVEYMSWLVQADWQPTFGGLFAASGTNSNMISLIYNQLNMMQQPGFTGITLPGNFNDVVEFAVSDRYWLWGSDRADISLFAQYTFLFNSGVAGVLSGFAQNGPTNGTLQGVGGTNFFGNVTENNFAAGIDFAY